MAEAKDSAAKGSGTGAGAPAGAAPSPAVAAEAPTLRKVWQVPALLVAGGLLVGGAVYALKTAPKPDLRGTFTSAEKFFGEEEYEKAIGALNTDVLPHVQKGALNPDQRRKYHLLVARSLALGQKKLGIDRQENNEAVVAQYLEAERRNATLEPNDRVMLAEAMIALGDEEGALKRAEGLPASHRTERVLLLRRMVERAFASPVPRDERALELLGRLAADADLSVDDRVWVTARQAEIVLARSGERPEDEAQKFARDVINRLLRALPRLQEAQPRALAELYVLLGRAYIDTGASEEARRQLDRAAGILGADDPLMAKVLLMQGAIDFNTDKARAQERYELIVSKFGSSSEFLPAMLGLAESMAFQAEHDQAVERYAKLVDRLVGGERARDVSAERVSSSLLRQFRERFQSGDYETALKYATVAEALHGAENSPAEVVSALAEVNRRLGEEALKAAGSESLTVATADPATQAVARRYFVEAGQHYRNHANRVVVSDNRAYGDSLRLAGDMFDRAGDVEGAIDAYTQFVSGFPTDERIPEVKFQLAQAQLARGDLGSAERLFRELRDGRGMPQGAGRYAEMSLVPLARTLMADANTENDDEARELLTAAVSGEYGGPGTESYRSGLEELANHHYRHGQFPEAIERLREYIGRYGAEKGEAKGGEVSVLNARYRLADSLRLNAARIKQEVKSTQMPDVQRRELETTREKQLREAMGLFERSRQGFEARRGGSQLDEVCLRNSYFYLGECAFELEDYDSAIRHYDAAKEKYSGQASSLVAMVQIVAAHRALGEFEKAKTANERARKFFASLPDKVWEDPTLPMSRADWERWLESTQELSSGSRVGSAKPDDKGGE